MTGFVSEVFTTFVGLFYFGGKKKFNLRILQKHQAKNYCLCTVHYLRAIFTINKNNKKNSTSTVSYFSIFYHTFLLGDIIASSIAMFCTTLQITYSILFNTKCEFAISNSN